MLDDLGNVLAGLLLDPFTLALLLDASESDWPGVSSGDPPDLEAAFKSATVRIEANRDDVEAYFTRGVICQSKGWSKRALAEFLEVLKRQPEHARAWLLMSEVLDKLNQPEPACEARKRALELDSSLQ